MTEIDNRIAALEAELTALKTQVAGEREPVISNHSSRREMFRRAALGAAGVAAAGTAIARTASPAAAGTANGQSLTIGQANTGTALTSLNDTGLKLSGATANAAVTEEGSRKPLLALGDGQISANANQIGLYANLAGVGSQGLSVSGTQVGARISSATGATLILGESTIDLPPASGTWEQGTLLRKGGQLYLCTAAGTPGTWSPLLPAASSSGTLHLLGSPIRVYDSRSGTGPASTAEGPLAAGATRLVSLVAGYIRGVPLPTAAVPAGATGAMVTLTVADTVGGGFLTIYSATSENPGTSNINWSAAGQFIATTTVSAVDSAAKVAVAAGGAAGAKTDFIIDVIGYYL